MEAVAESECHANPQLEIVEESSGRLIDISGAIVVGPGCAQLVTEGAVLAPVNRVFRPVSLDLANVR